MHDLKILIADDMAHERVMVRTLLKRELPSYIRPYFIEADTAEGAVWRARQEKVDLAILDIDFKYSEKSNGTNGIEAAVQIRTESDWDPYIVILSSDESPATMSRAVSDAKVDGYLRRSGKIYAELGRICQRALLSKLHRQGSLVKPEYQMVGISSASRRLARSLDRIDESLNVLIYGETGTGKELAVRRIHENAKILTQDKRRPLVVLDCASLSEKLFESEVFGHRKGAFTGAIEHKKGALEQANGGDLFLDEVQNMSISAQNTLLRVLNDGHFCRVGENERRRVNARVIAAANQPIHKLEKNGVLKHDFVARLDKFRVFIPPLRERGGDIPFIVDRILRKSGFDREFQPEALHYLTRLPWRTNFRELASIVESAITESKKPFIDIGLIKEIISSRAHESIESLESNFNKVETPLEAAVRDLCQKKVSLADAVTSFERQYLKEVRLMFRSERALSDFTGYSRNKLRKRLAEIESTG